MKTSFIVSMVSFGFFITTTLHATCLSCYKDAPSCYDQDNVCNFMMYPNSCQAADRGYFYNDCMSKCKYIKVFGNIGAM